MGFTRQRKGAFGAGRNAGSAAGTAPAVYERASADGLDRADSGAAEATEAEPAFPEYFRLFSLGFGVGTPAAAQRAAFKEDNRAYPRPVVDAEFLNIKNKPCFVQNRLFFRI
jgi:hypothetical protein